MQPEFPRSSLRRSSEETPAAPLAALLRAEFQELDDVAVGIPAVGHEAPVLSLGWGVKAHACCLKAGVLGPTVADFQADVRDAMVAGRALQVAGFWRR